MGGRWTEVVRLCISTFLIVCKLTSGVASLLFFFPLRIPNSLCRFSALRKVEHNSPLLSGEYGCLV